MRGNGAGRAEPHTKPGLPSDRTRLHSESSFDDEKSQFLFFFFFFANSRKVIARCESKSTKVQEEIETKF